ncbi:MAG: OadG family protein [Tissierella sp.]|uniref:OadG family protein n=1 Tax=Tissierella sp. TaxID=41274 RepID=UPI003F950862
MNLQDGVSISEALIVTLFSMGIVFLTLIVISLILGGFKLFFYEKDSGKLPSKEENNLKKNNIDADIESKAIDEELIAVIGAAIAAHSKDSLKKIDDEDLSAVIAAAIAVNDEIDINNVNIKSIKRI